jgi:hypothetical protein
MILLIGLWTFPRAALCGSAAIALENTALGHQPAVLQRSGSRPRLCRGDRILWVWLSRLWVGWRTTLVIVQPATVLAWHRRGFQLYWRWKSSPNVVGRLCLLLTPSTLSTLTFGRSDRENLALHPDQGGIVEPLKGTLIRDRRSEP